MLKMLLFIYIYIGFDRRINGCTLDDSLIHYCAIDDASCIIKMIIHRLTIIQPKE